MLAKRSDSVIWVEKWRVFIEDTIGNLSGQCEPDLEKNMSVEVTSVEVMWSLALLLMYWKNYYWTNSIGADRTTKALPKLVEQYSVSVPRHIADWATIAQTVLGLVLLRMAM